MADHNPNNPQLTSFVPVSSGSDFPIQNLPYCAFQHNGKDHLGVAIGDSILSLDKIEQAGLLKTSQALFQSGRLNDFMDQGKECWVDVRNQISQLLSHDNPQLRDNKQLRSEALIPQSAVKFKLPFSIGDYTDFYSSEEHARNVGTMFRGKDNALMPNWKHLPVGYHGRASSVTVSPSFFPRPQGQVSLQADAPPSFSPCQKLDFELELAFVVGGNSKLGEPVAIEQAEDHIFGLLLMNDWSARDIQKWEYVPLGPFVSKSFITTVSPFVVPYLAMEPFLVEGPKQEPAPLGYMQQAPQSRCHVNLELGVGLKAKGQQEWTKISETNAKYLYWSMPQQIAHHTVTGCNIRSGDLMASGTISGPTKDSFGSLLELTWNGQQSIPLAEGGERTFLEDGDQVMMRGHCENQHYRIGFGDLVGGAL